MGGFSLFHWSIAGLPLLGIAVLAGAVYLAVRAAKNAPKGAVDVAPPSPQTDALKKMAMVGYGLYAAALILPVTALATLILAYLKRDEARGTWLESHFRWQIRTFWFGLLWASLGMMTFFILIGWIVFVAAGVWFIYRTVRGWVALADGRLMYA